MFKGPFRELQMTVELGDPVAFTLAEPLSITSLVVTKSDDEATWEIIASEFQPVKTEGGALHTWPIDRAPPEIINLLEEIAERAERDMAINGPRKPPCSKIIYGEPS